MIEYLLSNVFTLFTRLVAPILLGVFAGGAISTMIQLFLHVEDRAVTFLGRYLGVAVGVYFVFKLSSATIVQYAERLWGGVDLYQ